MNMDLPNSSQLFNNGYMSLFPQKNDQQLDESTILIVGQARAGTTMVGLVLREMGIPMGERIGPVHEDNELGAFVPQLQTGVVPANFLCAVASRNKAYPIWAWKRPDLYSCLGVLTPKLRNPLLVCILRDAVALASRNCISLPDSSEIQSKAMGSLDQAIHEQKAIFDAICSTQLPTLLLSYEKAISRPDEFLGALARFVGKELNKEEQARLSTLVMPNHPGYALRARASKYVGDLSCRGLLEGVTDGFLLGRVALEAGRVVTVDVWVDGLRVQVNEFCGIPADGGVPEWTTFRLPVNKYLTRDSHALQLTFSSDGNNFVNSPYIWCGQESNNEISQTS
jgi:hypothetical protein